MRLLGDRVLLIIILIFAIPALLPLFHSGFYPFHDNAQVQRVYEMTKALKDGMFPVRWSQDLGYAYGYPIFNFYAPFIYYLGSIFYLIGMSVIASTKIVVGIGILLSGISMFLLAKKIFSPLAGFLAALLYVYAPYHAVDIYVRGDFAEAFAYSMIPFVFFAIFKLAEEYKWRWVVLGALSFAIIIATHNLTALMLTPILLVVLVYIGSKLYRAKKMPQLVALIALFIIAGCLSAFYWLPTFSEMHLTNVHSITTGGSDYHEHFVCLSQLWDSPWGFGGSAPGCIDGLSFRIGKLHVILSVFALFGFIYFYRKLQSKRTLFLGLFIGLVVSVLLTLQISQPIWDAIPFMAYFQFPWRFLLLISLFSSLLGGGVFWLLEKYLFKNKTIVIFITIFVILIGSFWLYVKLFQPQEYLSVTDRNYINQNELVWDTSKISDEYLSPIVKKPVNKNEALQYHPIKTTKVIFIRNFSQSTTYMQATLVNTQKQTITLHIDPFPAWHIFLDGKEVAYTVTSTGLQIVVPTGSHIVRAQFISTTVETIANSITIAGILLLFAGILIPKYERKNS